MAQIKSFLAAVFTSKGLKHIFRAMSFMKGCSAFKTTPSSLSNAIFLLFFMMPMSQILCTFDKLPFISQC